MSTPLTYVPAYLGLFAAQALAMACNAFLDIEYGSFTLEVVLWAGAFGLTLGLGWSQRGQVTDAGKNGQIIVLVLGALLSFVIFIPMWGFPRAGLAMLAAMQAAYNCVAVTRRHLHFGLLITAVMVMFAASHHRADWTLLFYLLPYVSAVVFTLVSEQINRRIEDLRQQSLVRRVARGQWTAIAAATSTILLLSAMLYAITPQVTWPNVHWRYGQSTNIGFGSAPGGGAAGQGEASGPATSADGAAHSRRGLGFPSPSDMREAAKRGGMPGWQSSAINRIADASQWVEVTMEPLLQGLQELLQSLKDWLDEHRRHIGLAILALATLALLYAMARLIGEARVGTWLLTRWDYLRLGLLSLHASGNHGARQYYGAMERLFALHEAERSTSMNTREYLAALCVEHGYLRRELTELTRLFEDARYGGAPVVNATLSRMRAVYREMYRSL